jgi:hypothetical protein
VSDYARAPQRVAAKSPQKIYRSQLMLGFDRDGDPLRTLRQWSSMILWARARAQIAYNPEQDRMAYYAFDLSL